MSEPTKQPDYIIDTVTDRNAVEACTPRAERLKGIRLYPLLGAILILIGIFFFSFGSLISGAFSTVFGALTIMMKQRMLKRVVEQQLSDIREAFGSESVPLRLVFWPQGIAMSNQLNNSTLNIRYEDISLLQAINNGQYFTIQAANGRWCIIRSEDIPDDGFLPYLLDHCPYSNHKGFKKLTYTQGCEN